jgi:predicted permease
MTMRRTSAALVRAMLALVPFRWRAPVTRDLAEEGARRGWGTVRTAWHALRIAAALRLAGGVPVASRARGGACPAPTGHRLKTATSHLAFDARLAVRSIVRQPGLAAAIAVTLGLGIGASTAAHAVFNFALFRPVPGVANERSLVSIHFRAASDPNSRAAASHVHLVAMREQVEALTGLAAWHTTDFPFDARPDGELTVRPITIVTRGFFDVVGAVPLIGRVFADEEYEAVDRRVAVISERLWRREFGARTDIGARTVLISGQAFRIVGVVRAFRGLERVGREDVWIPYAARGAVGRLVRDDGTHAHAQMVGRLGPEATVKRVQAEADAAFTSEGDIPDMPERYQPAVVAGLTDGRAAARARLLQIYWLLMSGVGLLFLLACANAANLMLARDVRRARALALRSAIGASRWRLTRELLFESLLLAGMAGAIGLGLARGMTAMFRGTRLLPNLPALDELALDWRVAGFAAVVAAGTVVLAGLLPAMLASRIDPDRALKGTGRGAARTGRLRTVLVAGQLALSMTLLAGAGLLTQTVWRLQSLDLGLDPAHVLTFTLSPTRLGYDDERTDRVFADTLAHLEAAPGIERVGVSYFPPFTMSIGQLIRLPGAADAANRRVSQAYVSSRYFEALAIPVPAGRAFTSSEADPGAARTNIVVLSAGLSRQLFGPDLHQAVGQQVVFPSSGGTQALAVGQTLGSGASAGSVHRVIGVAGDTRGPELRGGFQPTVYRPYGQQRLAAFQVRSSLPEADLVRRIRQAVRDVDSAVPVGDIASIGARIDRLLAEERVLAGLASVIAGIAVSISAAGVYAVIAFVVGDRTREFGIRLAIGAPRRAIAGGVIRSVLWMSGAGIAAGLIVAVTAGGLLAGRLYGVSPLDPLTLAGASALLLALALLAAWLPARRATRVDPTIALRAE